MPIKKLPNSALELGSFLFIGFLLDIKLGSLGRTPTASLPSHKQAGIEESCI